MRHFVFSCCASFAPDVYCLAQISHTLSRFSWPRPSLSFKVSYGQQYLQKTVTAKMFELDDALGEPKMGRLSRNHLLLETPCTKTCAESRTSITERNTELARAGDVMMALATRISVLTVQING